MGAVKGTNQTGELCGVIQALLWLLEHAFVSAMPQPESDQDGAGSPLKRMDARRKGEGGLEDEGNAVGDADEDARVLDEARAAYDERMAATNEHGVVICVDSLYAGNQLEGAWRVNCNKALIEVGQDLLRRVRVQREVTFIHVKGHSTDGGNDRADKLV
jgi:ribonuclease HI